MLLLLDSVLKASVLFAVAGALDVLFRHRAASLRHLTWTLAFAGALAVPVVSALVPTWRLPALASIGLPAPTLAVRAARIPVPDGTMRNAVAQAAPASASSRSAPVSVRSLPSPPPSVQSPDPVRFRLLVPWTSVAFLVWAAGSGLLLIRIVYGVWRAGRLSRRGRPMPAGTVRDLAGEITRTLELGGPVSLLAGGAGVMPMTWGIVSPVVLLPEDAVAWPPSRIRSVLLHELGHVKRHDCLTQLIARVACAVYWVNPLVWLAAARLRVEQELACDDLVLAAGSRPSEYAEHLVDVARALRAERLASVAAIAMARPSNLGRRVSALLDAGRERGVARAGLVVSASIAAAAFVLPLAGMSVWREGGEPGQRRDVAQARGTGVGSQETRAAGPVAQTSVAAVQTPGSSDDFRPQRSAMRAEIRDLGQRRARLVASVRGLALAGWNSIASALPALSVSVPSVSSTQSCAWDSEHNTSTSANVDDDAMTIRIRVGDCRLEIQSEGDVEFTDDDADVARISSGGYFEIEERQGRAVRRVEIRTAAGGLERRWVVNGDEQPYDAAARAWLAQMLPVVFRRSAIDAERRAQRILDRAGVDGLLQEIDLIPSDWAARQYFAVLLSQRDLDAATLRQVVQQAGRQIESDFELAQLLVDIADQQAVDENVRIAYVEAAGHIESSFERRRALSAVLGRESLSQELADAMLQQVVGIESDFEAASLLIEVVEARPGGAVLSPAFWQAVNGIESSFERRRVLNAVVERSAGNQATLEKVLESGAGVDSDFERAELLIAVAGQYPPNQALPASYLTAVGTMSSGFELRRALGALVERPGVTAPMLVSIVGAAQSIDSDFERAALLVALLQRYPLTEATREPFFAAAASIDGDFEQARVLKAVVAQKDLEEATVRALLVAAAGIDGDFELAELLVAIARAYPISEALRPEFLKAADAIEADFERGRVLNALYRRGTRADA